MCTNVDNWEPSICPCGGGYMSFAWGPCGSHDDVMERCGREGATARWGSWMALGQGTRSTQVDVCW